MRNGDFTQVRLRFIEAKLITHGSINRADITTLFGVTEPTATRDLRRYRQLNVSLVLNHSTKRWERSPEFQPTEGLLHLDANAFIECVEAVFASESREEKP
ncbi:hypothetical protein C3408_22635 [Candidatus Pantoea alvi]|nr:hypothetical protein C3408_22635 [Pantoea alvi]